MRTLYYALIFSAVSSWADIALIHDSGQVSVVYEENGSVFYKNCAQGTEGQATRQCPSQDTPYSMPYSTYYQNALSLLKVPSRYNDLQALGNITQSIEMIYRDIKASPLNEESKKRAETKLKALSQVQALLIQAKNNLFDNLGAKNARIDAAYNANYETVLYSFRASWLDEKSQLVWRRGDSDVTDDNLQTGCRAPWRVAGDQDYFSFHSVEGMSTLSLLARSKVADEARALQITQFRVASGDITFKCFDFGDPDFTATYNNTGNCIHDSRRRPVMCVK